MTEEDKKVFRDKLFELRLKQVYYTMGHKGESSQELASDIKELKRHYAKELLKDEEGEIKHVEHKRK